MAELWQELLLVGGLGLCVAAVLKLLGRLAPRGAAAPLGWVLYAPQDEDLCQELRRHLIHIKPPPRVWVALLSADFFLSGRCLDQARRALAAGDRVVPVLVRRRELAGTDFAGRVALPADGRPVCDYADRDEAWVEVVRAVNNSIEKHVAAAST